MLGQPRGQRAAHEAIRRLDRRRCPPPARGRRAREAGRYRLGPAVECHAQPIARAAAAAAQTAHAQGLLPRPQVSPEGGGAREAAQPPRRRADAAERRRQRREPLDPTALDKGHADKGHPPPAAPAAAAQRRRGADERDGHDLVVAGEDGPELGQEGAAEGAAVKGDRVHAGEIGEQTPHERRVWEGGVVSPPQPECALRRRGLAHHPRQRGANGRRHALGRRDHRARAPAGRRRGVDDAQHRPRERRQALQVRVHHTPVGEQVVVPEARPEPAGRKLGRAVGRAAVRHAVRAQGTLEPRGRRAVGQHVAAGARGGGSLVQASSAREPGQQLLLVALAVGGRGEGDGRGHRRLEPGRVHFRVLLRRGRRGLGRLRRRLRRQVAVRRAGAAEAPPARRHEQPARAPRRLARSRSRRSEGQADQLVQHAAARARHAQPARAARQPPGVQQSTRDQPRG
ncbi:hypothetical protein T492DRAFT_1039031 [Pavlovales sp. CCMP2436]|nr:hypothetical protein T492DRAFT_1039031 [Pavlovales sp. CCMP2436]